jgi:signal transduction histidine kinase
VVRLSTRTSRQGSRITPLTVNEAAPFTPFAAAAEIVTGPAATPVATPAAVMVALAADDDDHVKVCPDMTVPEASFATAANCTVPPTDTEAAVLVTVTEATDAAPPVGPLLLELQAAKATTERSRIARRIHDSR